MRILCDVVEFFAAIVVEMEFVVTESDDAAGISNAAAEVLEHDSTFDCSAAVEGGHEGAAIEVGLRNRDICEIEDGGDDPLEFISVRTHLR